MGLLDTLSSEARLMVLAYEDGVVETSVQHRGRPCEDWIKEATMTFAYTILKEFAH